MSKLAYQISEKIIKNKKNKIFIIGIDGPTASGKTILANNIQKKLGSIKTFIIRMDWTLKSRHIREKSLKKYTKNNKKFLFEAEEHMNLKIVSDALKKIKDFNSINQNKELQINLKNLYNREITAKNDLNIRKKLTKNFVVIVEGHYTGHPSINKYLDFNILLLSNKKELLRRKIERVKNYRSEKITRKYFELIDAPSFLNFISRFGNNYSMIVDNSNYLKPKIESFNKIKKWVEKIDNLNTYRAQNLNFNQMYESLKISDHLIDQGLNKKNFNCILNFINKLDQFTAKNFRLAVKDIDVDIDKFIKENINTTNKILKRIKLVFCYTNNFHNLYYKKFPIICGFKIINELEKINLGNITIQIDDKLISSKIYWEGGTEEIISNRKLTTDDKENIKFNYKKLNIFDFQFKNINISKNFIPTDFTNINFFEKLKKKNILVDREESNINYIQILNEFNDTNIFWIQRFAKFIERDFVAEILNKKGILSFSINNYLFAIKSADQNVYKKFENFFLNWKLNYKDKIDREVDEKFYDKIIDNNRDLLKKEVNKKTKNFKVLDGKIFYLSNQKAIKNKFSLKKDLKFLLGHSERIVRKSTINFLILNGYNLDLNTKLLWTDEIDLPKKNIKLSELIKISPTILSDIYFWLNLKRENSSILAANIYDIRKNSFDIAAFLKASQEENTPIVLQSSFNAIGHKEKYKSNESTGYLRIKNGAKEFTDNVIREARNLYLQTGKDFLFGIGIDHLDFRHDKPKGRIFRFLKSCEKTKLITHYTLDSSFLLEDKKLKNFKSQKNKIVKKIINNEISLLQKIKDNHLLDFEYCANELNYIENEQKVFLPNQSDIKFFVNEFNKQISSKKLNYIKVRPKLFIGNLGTVHHGEDKNNNVKTNMSEKWIDATQKYNFISAVLHGTSRSHPEVLKRATAGCMKINVAGDFLQILVGNLPNELKKIVSDKNDNEKKKLHLIRLQMNKIKHQAKNKISSSLYFKCKDLINLIKSPSMTNNDREYFRYNLYNFSTQQIEYISTQATDQILNFNIVKKTSNKKINQKFLMSPIELDYGSYFKKIVRLFNKHKIFDFHLDVGDGEFIPRELDVTNKLKFIKKINKKNKIHLHLMVKNPNKNKTNYGESYINHYAQLGSDFIGLHRRSFDDHNEFENSIKKIIKLKKEPSIFLEINETFDKEIIMLIKKYKIKLITFMGVPLGYGGQFFKINVIPNIKYACDYINKNKLKTKIEIDGGINFEILEQLKQLNVSFFSGWSIIKSNNEKSVENKLKLVKKILK